MADKKQPAKKAASAKPEKKPAAKPAPKAEAKKPAAAPKSKPEPEEEKAPAPAPAAAGPVKVSGFVLKQRQRLLDLRDELVDAMSGMTGEIRNAPEGSEASGSGMHQGDAGSDAYDRDFALSVLAKEQDALYEIEQALRRIDRGAYGICEMSGKAIPQARLEAIPFARLTVECQKRNTATAASARPMKSASPAVTIRTTKIRKRFPLTRTTIELVSAPQLPAHATRHYHHRMHGSPCGGQASVPLRDHAQ